MATPLMDPTAAAAHAAELADSAARACGLRISEIHAPAEAAAAADLLRDIWRPATGWPVPPEMLLVLAHTGNYAVQTHRGGDLVAVSAGLRTGDPDPALHSHITGVAQGHRGRSIGQALKLYQRAWALARGITTVTWTFDPLHRRNAAFNLTRLGGRLSEYLPNFYGEMSDSVNRGTRSDRALMVWDLLQDPPPLPDPDRTARGARRGATEPTSALVRLDDHGRPFFSGLPHLTHLGLPSIRVPEDIEALRVQDPDLARAWQAAVHEAFTAVLGAGLSVVAFDPAHHYVLNRTEPHATRAR